MSQIRYSRTYTFQTPLVFINQAQMSSTAPASAANSDFCRRRVRGGRVAKGSCFMEEREAVLSFLLLFVMM